MKILYETQEGSKQFCYWKVFISQNLFSSTNGYHHELICRMQSLPRAQGVLELGPLELDLFGRLDTDNHVRNHIVQIANQDFLPHATWRQLHQLTNNNLPINEVDFVRMWKTIIFKRVLDVYEKQKKHKVSDQFSNSWHLRLGVPAPLGDLLYSLGSYFDEVEGVCHGIIPPPVPAELEPWRTFDNDILLNWLTMINQVSSKFLIKEYPPTSQYKGSALILCTIQDDIVHGTRCIKGRFKGPTPLDAYVRFLNDELFHDPYAPSDCPYMMTEPLNRTAVTCGYLGKYCT